MPAAIDDDIVWREGISVNEAPNHKVRTFDSNRISLLHLLIALLSQPLFYSPEEYLTVLNPFSTYLTSRKCKNVKNLFVSLLNVVLSYDTKGYVSPHIVSKRSIGHSLRFSNWHSRRSGNPNKPVSAPILNNDRVQTAEHRQPAILNRRGAPHPEESIHRVQVAGGWDRPVPIRPAALDLVRGLVNECVL